VVEDEEELVELVGTAVSCEVWGVSFDEVAALDSSDVDMASIRGNRWRQRQGRSSAG